MKRVRIRLLTLVILTSVVSVRAMPQKLHLFRNYGKDALLLSVLAYNVGPYRILGTKKIPKSRLLRKIERGDRNIYNGYISFCRWHGRQVKSIKFRRQVEYDLFFVR